MHWIKFIIYHIYILLFVCNIYGQKNNSLFSNFHVVPETSLIGNNWESFYLRNSSAWITANAEDYNICHENSNGSIIHCIEKTGSKNEEAFIYSTITNIKEEYDSIIFHADILIPDKANLLYVNVSSGKFYDNISLSTNNNWQKLRLKIPYGNTDADRHINIYMVADSMEVHDKIYLKDICLTTSNNDTVCHSTEGEREDFSHVSSDFSFPSNKIKKKYIKRLETLCLVWGFMKYYHKDIRSGKYDWNHELLRMLPTVFEAKSYTKFCNKIDSFIPRYTIKKECGGLDKPEYLSQISKKWISRSRMRKNLYRRMSKMDRYGCEDDYIYCAGFLSGDDEQKSEKIIYFPNEESYDDIPVEDGGYRMLALFRFWNMMYYFHPYMYQKEKRWIKELPQYIRLFAGADNARDFDIACTVVADAMKDTHTEMYGLRTNVAGTQIWNDHYLPFEFKLTDDSRLLVTKATTEEAKACGLKLGDYICKVNGRKIKDIRDERTKFSNFGKISTDQYADAYASFTGDSVMYTIERNGKDMDIYIDDYRKYWGENIAESPGSVRMLDNEICYINIGNISNDRLKELLPTVKNKKGIIFDMRGYPDKWNETRREIARFLYPHKKTIWYYAHADLKHPGTFRKNIYEGAFGEDNADCYKGMVVVLVDGRTMSAAEHVAEIIRNSPNGTVIGESTGGVLGRVSYAPFTSGRAARFTGAGIYRPDMTCTYPGGIIIDISVFPTPDDIRNNIDEKIKTAVNIIKYELR